MKSLIVSLLILISLQSFANEYFVSTTGNNNNNGTITNPFRTIQYALSQTQNNDTISVFKGTYTVYGNLVIPHDGILLRAVENEVFVEDISQNLYPDKLINFNHHKKVIFDGFCIYNTADWAIWVDGDSCIVRNCVLYNCYMDAINVIGASHNLITNNTISNIGYILNQDTIKANAITIEGKVDSNCNFTAADSNIIEYNLITNVKAHFGINLIVSYASLACSTDNFVNVGNIIRYNKIDTCWSGIYVRQQQKVHIYDNIITAAFQKERKYEGHGIKFDFGALNLSRIAANSYIYNNTIAYCAGVGIYNLNCSFLYIYNNSLYQNNAANGACYIWMKDTNNLYISNNSYNGSNLLWGWDTTKIDITQWQSHENIFSTGDPAFVNPIGRNFYPQSSSDLRGNGLSLTSIDSLLYNNIDIINHSRPSDYNRPTNVWDIGAYEYYGDLPKYASKNKTIMGNYVLGCNYPNPFNPSTTIKCSIPVKGIYTLKVYNVLGQEIAILNNKELQEGEHTFYFNAKDKPSGVYIYQLMGENVNLSKKMLLLK